MTIFTGKIILRKSNPGNSNPWQFYGSRTPGNSNYFSLSLEGSNYQELTVWTIFYMVVYGTVYLSYGSKIWFQVKFF